MKKIITTSVMLWVILASTVQAAEDALPIVQTQWASCQYQTADQLKNECFKKLEKMAADFQHREPVRNDLKVWLAIVKSTYAGVKGGLGALSLAKEAKVLLDDVIAKEPTVLDGSAYTSLGSLYYQVPGWPLGFGDDKKAKELLTKALVINPTGIDPNYFYGDFLLDQGDKVKAREYFVKALQAPPRQGRETADTGRRGEITAKLATLK
jgi:tetratricopeptide (TPR) repeat protein